MLTALRRVFVGTHYIRLRRGWLSVRNVETGETAEGETVIALETQGAAIRIAAVGAKARALAGQLGHSLADAFTHPRSPIGNFTLAEKTVMHFIRRLEQGDAFKPMRRAVVHVLDAWQDGLTQIEIRALRELFENAGYRTVAFWEGVELRDEQIVNWIFPQAGGHLIPDVIGEAHKDRAQGRSRIRV